MLTQAMNDYLAVRRAAGFKLRSTQNYLRSFVRFATVEGDCHIRVETAISWAAQARTESERTRRLRVVRLFARFMRAEDSHHEVPPEQVFCGYQQRPSPYLFTDDELHRLLVAAHHLPPSGSLRPHTYSTLFTLLAVTGLRPGEALALRMSDLTTDGLIIRESKFRKSRLVPLHPTTQAALERYLQRRRQVAGSDDHLFISLKRGPLAMSSAANTFRQVLKAADVPDRPGRPRLYDLRHRFATQALERAPTDRHHIDQHIVALSTYLGHRDPRGTYWYLEQTPQLMADIAERCEVFVTGGTP